MDCKKVTAKQRHRHADARWRAAISNCFDTVKVIAERNRNYNTRVSKLMILKETKKYIGFLQDKVKSLTQRKEENEKVENCKKQNYLDESTLQESLRPVCNECPLGCNKPEEVEENIRYFPSTLSSKAETTPCLSSKTVDVSTPRKYEKMVSRLPELKRKKKYLYLKENTSNSDVVCKKQSDNVKENAEINFSIGDLTPYAHSNKSSIRRKNLKCKRQLEKSYTSIAAEESKKSEKHARSDSDSMDECWTRYNEASDLIELNDAVASLSEYSICHDNYSTSNAGYQMLLENDINKTNDPDTGNDTNLLEDLLQSSRTEDFQMVPSYKIAVKEITNNKNKEGVKYSNIGQFSNMSQIDECKSSDLSSSQPDVEYSSVLSWSQSNTPIKLKSSMRDENPLLTSVQNCELTPTADLTQCLEKSLRNSVMQDMDCLADEGYFVDNGENSLFSEIQ